MAIALNGIFGHQNGRIGNVVFYTLNGRNVSRMIGRYVDKPSPDQEANRNTMTVVMKFLQSMAEMVKLGFDVEAKGTVRNAFNLAVSHNKKHALTGQGEAHKINYKKVLLSRGVLPSSEKTSITKVDGGVLIEWEISTGNKAYGSDMVMIALHYPGSNGTDVSLNAAKRGDGKVFIPVHKSLRDEPVETYMFFRSANGERVSDSIYLGNMNGKVMTPAEYELYVIAVAALTKAQGNFGKQEQKFVDTGKKTKAYKDLDKECRVWRDRIYELSGRPA